MRDETRTAGVRTRALILFALVLAVLMPGALGIRGADGDGAVALACEPTVERPCVNGVNGLAADEDALPALGAELGAVGQPLKITYTSVGSGTIGTRSFTNAAFTVTALANTGNRTTSGTDVYSVVHDAAAITITGVGTFAFTSGTRTFVNISAGIAGFARSSSTDLIYSPTSTSLRTWYLNSSIGPLTGGGRLLQWSLEAVSTSGGTLVFSSAYPTVTFTVVRSTSCVASATSLCIGNRFQIEIDWATVQSNNLSGKARAVPASAIGFAQGGIFWFFDSANPEMLVKVLNGCSVNNRYWFFASAGTNVGMLTRVADILTGQQRMYVNPDLVLAAPIGDTSALATCP